MRTSSGLPRRLPLRLPHVDGSIDAAWFVTLCSFEKAKIFGRVIDQRVDLTPVGEIVAEEWMRSAEVRPEVILDEWIVMPNHLHAIVFVPAACGAPAAPGVPDAPGVPAARRAALHRVPRSLGSLVAGFKSTVTSRVRRLTGDSDYRVWQYKYHEHGIRSAHALDRIREYIRDNPSNWLTDPENL